MWLTTEEIAETIRMFEMQDLDIRTVTLGIDLHDCIGTSLEDTSRRCHDKILRMAGNFCAVVDRISLEFGIPVANRRIAITPAAVLAAASAASDLSPLAAALDRAADQVGVDYLGGFSALVAKGMTPADRALINSLPRALNSTSKVCGSVTVAATRAGINMDAVALMGHTILEISKGSIGDKACSKLVVFGNAVEDNPFMAGAFHGWGEAECTVNVGISGPGVVRAAVAQADPGLDLGDMAEIVKKTAFKITRMGELLGREVARRMNCQHGSVDLSLAPTPRPGDSVADILEALGLERCGTHGSTAALAMLTDAVKKGGTMAATYVGGLSGAFIPVCEDASMDRAVVEGALSIDKLEAMTSVCSVGLDMVVIPGDTPPETIAAIIADEMAISVMNDKTIGVRIIPAQGKRVGDRVEFGGLFGGGVVMPVNPYGSAGFVRRGGRIPPPARGMKN